MRKAGPFHFKYVRNGCVPEPRKPVKGKEQFLLANQYPEPVPGDVGDFNPGSVDAKRF
jgi:hypothetical protein